MNFNPSFSLGISQIITSAPNVTQSEGVSLSEYISNAIQADDVPQMEELTQIEETPQNEVIRTRDFDYQEIGFHENRCRKTHDPALVEIDNSNVEEVMTSKSPAKKSIKKKGKKLNLLFCAFCYPRV